ncbi:MAG: hypothetical protein JKY57_03650 [Kordiimonadaceae bacterium]|nr:hypothetical protein [Kordiimonadaceae bacterium]
MEKIRSLTLLYIAAFLVALSLQLTLANHIQAMSPVGTVGYTAGFAAILTIVPTLFLFNGGTKSPWLSLAALSGGALIYASAFL